MTEKNWVDLIRETQIALYPHYAPPMDEAAQALGLERPQVRLLWGALTLEPAPVSVERIGEQAPYLNPEIFRDALENLAQLGYLTPVEGQGYQLAETGRRAVERTMQGAHSGLASITALSPDETEDLEGLLAKLVSACLEADEPAQKRALVGVHRTAPGEGAPTMAHIEQYLSDLGAYRDDAHIAAWKPYDIEGNAWEAFTFIWQDEATTLEALYEKLKHRGFLLEDYAAALEDLRTRAWIEELDGIFHTTQAGEQVRQEAEQLTDAYYYAPWEVLSEDERQTLRALLSRLMEGAAT